MGTANFTYNHRLGLKVLRAATLDLEAENASRAECDLEPIGADNWDYQSEIVAMYINDDVQYMRELLDKAKPKFVRNDGRKIRVSMKSIDGDYTNTIGQVCVELWRYGQEICLSADLVLRSGYYDGANIDADNFDLNGYDYDFDTYQDVLRDDYDFDTYQDVLRDDYDLTDKQIAKLLRDKTLERDLRALENVLFAELDDFLKPFCDDYSCATRFSNGETWYSKN
nr:MAG TPA: hypothetical protein [Caudoviricetes sp.]